VKLQEMHFVYDFARVAKLATSLNYDNCAWSGNLAQQCCKATANCYCYSAVKLFKLKFKINIAVLDCCYF